MGLTKNFLGRRVIQARKEKDEFVWKNTTVN
jgi:hypothetical protein